MSSHRFWQVLCAGLVALGVAGCGGGGGADGGFGGGDGGSGGNGGGGNGGGTVTPVYKLGRLSGSTFIEGSIAVGQSPLSAGGTSGLRVDIVDTANGNSLFVTNTDVTFSSLCVGSGTSTISPNPVTTTTGSANSSYLNQGCVGDDTITASATVAGTVLSATGVITNLPATLGSVVFVSAVPSTIFVPGGGGPQTSIVTFNVKNNAGGNAPNVDVAFSLDTDVGGIQLSSDSGSTDSSGNVSVTVNAGRVSTPVVVTAAIVTPGGPVSSQSSGLSVNAGVPDQDSFSLSVQCPNVEALARDGVVVPVTLRAAGRDNNPVSDGRSINFRTEGGSIQSACPNGTIGGACSVNWTSQNPRPFGFDGCSPGELNFENDTLCAGKRPGRSSILATGVGEESFTDTDSDGLRDDSEINNFSLNDLPEAFLDDDEDGNFDTLAGGDGHDETPIDFNRNGAYDEPDGKFNGLYCDPAPNDGVAAFCAPTTNERAVHVRARNLIIMSGSTADISYDAFPDGDVLFSGAAGVSYADGTLTIPDNGSATIGFVVRDVNNQPMPANTSVQFSIDGDASISGSSSFNVPCSSNDAALALSNRYFVRVRADDLDADGSANLEMKVTTPGPPSGSGTVVSYPLNIVVNVP